MSTLKLYTSQDLPAEAYHSDKFPQVSGSILAAIHETCPAEWKYGEKKESAAMQFGTASHAALLEQDRFYSEFIRGIDPAEYPEALTTTNASMEKWLKERGIKCSGMDKEALIDAIDATGESPVILARLYESHAKQAEETGATVVPAKDYDTIVKMRDALHRNDYDGVLKNGQVELSCIGDDVKCRWDFVDLERPRIVDYKTTTSANPELFGNQAYKMNYWLKMAFQADIFEAKFGEFPEVILYAQSKKPPYIAVPYAMTAEQLQVGREQYQAAKAIYDRCVESNVWPAYGRGVQELVTPVWVAKSLGFGFDEIVEVGND